MREGSVGEVGCFGKLPISPEFIRVQAKGGTLEAFDEWIQEGLLSCRVTLGPTWKDLFLESNTWNFLFHVPQQKEWLIGVMVPSQDKAGRMFPMTLFLRVEKPSKGHAFMPLLFQEFLERGKLLLQDGWKHVSLVEFREQVQRMMHPGPLQEEPIRQLYQEFLDSYSLNSFLEVCGISLSYGTDSEVKRTVQNMGSTNHSSQSSHMGQLMSFPLIEEPAFPFEIPFWMEYVASIQGRQMIAPLLFWNKCPSRGKAAFLFQDAPVTSKSFGALIQSDEILESTWNMRSLNVTETSLDDEALKQRVPHADNLQDATLSSLLVGQHI